jgi:5'-nucleotidase / UDP-sugar diphosphatase
LAREIDGIDLIIGGHTHTPLHRMEIVDGTRIVQAGSGLRSVGRVRLVWEPDARRVVDARYSLVRLDAERWGQDASVRSLVDYFAETASREIGVNLNEIVGTAAQELTRDYRAESPLGNWQTDAMRAAAEADIALQNSGGIRENMPAGPVRVRDLYQISPFGNTLVVMRLRGQTLWELLEHGVSGPQGILQVSGLRMEYDPRRPAGYRLLSVSVKGAPLEMDKWYVVATNSFLAQGGDGYEGFKRGWNIVDTKKTLLDVQIEAMKKGGKASAEREGRIVPL